MASRTALDDAAADGDVPVAVRVLKTPIGVLQVAASQGHLLYVQLPRPRAARGIERWLHDRLMVSRPTPVLVAALDQLREYFAGKRRVFDVPVQPRGTEFQRRVWQRVHAIPFGETVAYGTIAADLGGPRVARAVGAAVGANPIPIVIPCHRVIGADGSLTGYAGGLRRKIWLLRHEGVLLA